MWAFAVNAQQNSKNNNHRTMPLGLTPGEALQGALLAPKRYTRLDDEDDDDDDDDARNDEDNYGNDGDDDAHCAFCCPAVNTWLPRLALWRLYLVASLRWPRAHKAAVVKARFLTAAATATGGAALPALLSAPSRKLGSQQPLKLTSSQSCLLPQRRWSSRHQRLRSPPWRCLARSSA